MHQVESLYGAVYFYDSQFWVVSIPIIYGTVQLNALNCLHEMPEGIKHEMMADHNRQAWDYVIYWADCVEYGMGINDLRKTQGLDESGVWLLMSAKQEMRTGLYPCLPSIALILVQSLIVEWCLRYFFRSYIALKTDLPENEAKAIGHNLNKGLDKFIEVSGLDDWKRTRDFLKVLFPEIHERHKEQDIMFQKLWDGYSLAHSVGTVIIRECTDRNTLELVMASNKVN